MADTTSMKRRYSTGSRLVLSVNRLGDNFEAQRFESMGADDGGNGDSLPNPDFIRLAVNIASYLT